MRFTTLITVLTVVVGIHADLSSDAATECGDLGVFSPSTLPDGVDPTALRKCLEHPLVNKTAQLQQLHARACYSGSDGYGCSGNYCWRACGTPGSGEWCWLALNGGYGAWRTCADKGDCIAIDGSGCGQGGCSACGCSC